MEELKNTINNLDFLNLYKTFHSTITEYTLF